MSPLRLRLLLSIFSYSLHKQSTHLFEQQQVMHVKHLHKQRICLNTKTTALMQQQLVQQHAFIGNDFTFAFV
jgi:hypothetical protein